MPKSPEELRSFRWFGHDDLRSFGHRSRLVQMGYSLDEIKGKPVIAIINTWSDINPCHTHFKRRVEDVKRGVWQAGGFPIEIPAMTLDETYTKPTSMLYRNFLAMEVEELLRSHPADGAVLMGGCDKTTPATIMGAISMNIPTLFMPAGPMLRGNWGGKILGSGSDVWKYWAERKAGNITDAQWLEMEQGIARSYGTCMTMGTASTMTALAETLSMALPGSSSIPASDSGHSRMAARTGARVVEMVWQDIKPRDVLTPQAFENALVVHMALAGSTNAIVHLIAMARRAGVHLTIDDFDRVAGRVPVLANLRPSGAWLMEDFFYAGGLLALQKELGSLLDLEVPTASGKSLGEALEFAQNYNPDVIRPLSNPVSGSGGLAVLRGNLAPEGCVMKPAAAEPRLLEHTGPAVVFETYNDLVANIDREDLDVTADSVLVLRTAGPVGGPGMPEWGMLPIPKKLLQQGVRDMVRISDARMSGTSYGACVLHVSPESYVKGPLAAVRTGDLITISVSRRSIELHLSDEEIARRLADYVRPPRDYPRGFGLLSAQHISQAHDGCDFDFLTGTDPIPEPEIH
ncbi:L-arabinonate dehydratase [Chelativorans sp.]|uniref:L-arabinonate dehydratase n=1 Tax=Chelativorans sp. TaxID=2203393 RepID=UPI002810ECF3|nr:L-arabinonate dehydratase [Chelativorans sp.]